MRVVTILATYTNEERFVADCLEHFFEQNERLCQHGNPLSLGRTVARA
jgi:hypothetical protein